MCNCCAPCDCEDKRSEVCRTVGGLVENMMWKIRDREKEEAETLMLKFFQFLGKAKSLESVAEALIKYEADLKIKDLKADVEEEAIESKEDDLSTMFN